jgi:hypothetical protein
MTVLLVPDHDRRCEAGGIGRTQDGLLEERALGGQGEELLGVQRAGQWPQAGPGSAAQHHRVDASLPYRRRVSP